MEKRAYTVIPKQEEDWDADLLTVPAHQPSIDRQATFEGGERARNQNTRVFYNQQFHNNASKDTDQRKDKRDWVHNGVKERPHKSSFSDSSDGNGRDDDGNFSRRSAESAASSRDFNRGHNRGRGRGTVFRDKDKLQGNSIRSEQDGHYKEHIEDVERCKPQETKYRNDKQYPTRRRENNRVPKDDITSESPKCVSASETKGSVVKLPLKVNDDFPALTKQTVSTSQPNYWTDRHAFVKDARPSTEDEEAEMIRLALEASRLEEEERRQKVLEEENCYKSLLLESSQSRILFDDLTLNDIEEPTHVASELRDNSLVTDQKTSKHHIHTVSAAEEVPLNTRLSVIEPSMCESNLSAFNSSLLSFMDNGNCSSITPAIEPTLPASDCKVGYNHAAFSFNSDLRQTSEESLRNTIESDACFENEESESSACQSPPEVIYQSVTVDQLYEPHMPDVVYQTCVKYDASTSSKVNSLCVAASDSATNDNYEISDGFNDGHDTDMSESKDYNSTDIIASCPADYVAHNNSLADLDDTSCVSSPPSDVCGSPVSCTSPNILYMAENNCMPVPGFIPPYSMCSYPAGLPGYPMMPAQAFNPMGQMAFFPPGYPQYFQNGVPALPAWPYGFQSVMMPPTNPPPGLVPPPGVLPVNPLPMSYPALAASPHAWYSQRLGYPFIPGAPVSPFLSMSNIRGVDNSSSQKDSQSN